MYISGHRWAAYIDSGIKFLEEEHEEKLVSMLKIAISKERSVI